jgi:hypothetical protein
MTFLSKLDISFMSCSASALSMWGSVTNKEVSHKLPPLLFYL